MDPAMCKITLTLSALVSGRGALHIVEILLCLITFILSAVSGVNGQTFWFYAMFTWSFCPIMTLIITVLELLGLSILLNMFCMDWADFTTGMAMTSTLMTVSVAIYYPSFYACWKCVFGVLVSVLAFLCALVYLLEVIKDKVLDGRKGSYLSAMPGFFKVMEAFVSCIIFLSLTGYRESPLLVVCAIAYAIPFPILPVIMIVNILKCLRMCVPCNLDRCSMIFLALSVLLYVFTAIAWPILTFKSRWHKDKECPRRWFCPRNAQFLVLFLTFLNLVLFVVDLVLTVLGRCGFRRG